MSVRSLPSLWELFQRASSLSTEIFDKAPSGQVTPYSCLLGHFDDGMTFRDCPVEGCVPHVNVVENHPPFLSTAVYFLDCQIGIPFQASGF